ncbi:hypothetical protein R1sor_006686 [Riccia sorocarpa]|uniref:Uncharacterized protein n=1 Tax=Riccia sorocarpa TaxID=122646 RepID=A0ABD3HSH8_9MARC
MPIQQTAGGSDPDKTSGMKGVSIRMMLSAGRGFALASISVLPRVDEYGEKRENSEEEVVRSYNERVHKVIQAWKNLHGLFENIQNDSVIKPLIHPDQGNAKLASVPVSVSSSGPVRDIQAEPDFERQVSKRDDEEIVRKYSITEWDHTTAKSKVQVSALAASLKEERNSKVLPTRVQFRMDKENKDVREERGDLGIDQETEFSFGSPVEVVSDRRHSLTRLGSPREVTTDRRQSLSTLKELAEGGLDRDKNDKTAQVIKEISERKVKERAAGKVKLIGALASELGDEVRMLKDQLHQIKLEKRQLEEKNLQKDRYIRSLVDERKQLLSRINKLSDELNALSDGPHMHFKPAEPYYGNRSATPASVSRVVNKRTTPTKQ